MYVLLFICIGQSKERKQQKKNRKDFNIKVQNESKKKTFKIK